MAPDRGATSGSDLNLHANFQRHTSAMDDEDGVEAVSDGHPQSGSPDSKSEEKQFTIRALIVGIVIGILIAFSNTYFGLQTGWISGMAMPSALIGFAYFKGLRALASRAGGPLKRLGLGAGFSEVENVLVQSVAGSVGTMPLGCGFVGVIPALEFLLRPSETPHTPSQDADILAVLANAEKGGGLRLPLSRLVLWALGICFFGVVFAVPLRKEVIIREKLKFPSGTATALMIGVLHGGEKTGQEGNIEKHWARQRKISSGAHDEQRQRLIQDDAANDRAEWTDGRDEEEVVDPRKVALKKDWAKQIQLLLVSFAGSGFYVCMTSCVYIETFISYFVPQLHSIPFLGSYLSDKWVWNLNPSPAYVGQGIIMGPATTIHMFLGAIIGWAILSPVAKHEGWAPGPVSDWNTGSKGWIVWISLAIMLADALVNLGWLALRPILSLIRTHGPSFAADVKQHGFANYVQKMVRPAARGHIYSTLPESPSVTEATTGDLSKSAASEGVELDAPPEHLIGIKTTLITLVLTLAFCIMAVHFSFAGIIPISLTVLALVLALFLSIMGVRALGETDLNPVSGISKLTQLFFALVTPAGNPNAVTINLIAGAISEAGAIQAGDLLQDLKTGHLLGASPAAQFWGQIIGSGVGAVVSACVYRLYTNVYEIPGGLFQTPTAYVWIFTARLVTGQGLPPRVAEAAALAAALWVVLTALRIYGASIKAKWVPYVPGGIAVAVGMYNTPSFTLARTFGGLISWYWTRTRGEKGETSVIILASGLILGEGILSIVNLALASAGVPHL